MLKAINTKILLAILAALSAIGGAVTYQRHETEKAAAAAAKAAAILRQQVEQNKKRHNSAAAHEGKTWQKYIP